MRINRSAPNLVTVCIDHYRAYDFSGSYINKYSRQPEYFSTAQELLAKLEQFYDDINFPQAAFLERRLIGKTRPQPRKDMKQVQELDEMMEHKGELATFVIHVQYRQNATWQGKLVWADKKRECSFRSALEMIKLMDQALDTTPAAGGDDRDLE